MTEVTIRPMIDFWVHGLFRFNLRVFQETVSIVGCSCCLLFLIPINTGTRAIALIIASQMYVFFSPERKASLYADEIRAAFPEEITFEITPYGTENVMSHNARLKPTVEETLNDRFRIEDAISSRSIYFLRQKAQDTRIAMEHANPVSVLCNYSKETRGIPPRRLDDGS